MKRNVLIVNQKDNVIIALEDIKKGSEILSPGIESFPVLSDIPYGHKIALTDIRKGSDVLKYGEPIGQVKSDIKKGTWIHIHNMGSYKNNLA